MKRISATLLLFLFTHVSFSQIVYQGYFQHSFQKLLKDGFTYMKSGNAENDEIYLKAIEENWTLSDFKVYDAKNPAFNIADDDIVLLEAKINNEELIVAWIEYKYIKSGSTSKKAAIGYMGVNGFNQKTDLNSKKTFLPLVIAGFHDMIVTMKKNQIGGSSTALYNRIYKTILPKSRALRKKTLLIIDDTQSYVSQEALNEAKIKFKLISTADYKAMSKAELAQYCLMYFASNTFTEMTIMDLEDNSLVFSRQFMGSNTEFGKKELKNVVKQF